MSPIAVRRFLLLTALLLALTAVDAKPFFDAIFDAINGNGRRSYGYNGYNGYNGYDGYHGRGYGDNGREEAPRRGKSYSEICRVHYPDAIAFPGAGGITCPY